MLGFRIIKVIVKFFGLKYGEELQEAYHADGVDLQKKTLNGSHAAYKNNKLFINSPLTTFSSFLGLPNRKLDDNEPLQSWKNLGRNFIGWQKDISNKQLILNGFLLTPLNLFLTPLKFARNLLRLFAIVIPGTISRFLGESGSFSLSYNLGATLNLLFINPNETGILKKIGLTLMHLTFALGGLTLVLASLPFGVFQSFARDILSPINTVRDTYYSFASWNKFVQLLFTSMSVVGVISIYAAVLPLATLALYPLMATTFPRVVNAINASLRLIAPILADIGAVVMPIAKLCANALTLGIRNLSHLIVNKQIAVGLGATIGAAFVTLGIGINNAINKFKNYWHGYTPERDEEYQRMINESTDPNSASSTLLAQNRLALNPPTIVSPAPTIPATVQPEAVPPAPKIFKQKTVRFAIDEESKHDVGNGPQLKAV